MNEIITELVKTEGYSERSRKKPSTRMKKKIQNKTKQTRSLYELLVYTEYASRTEEHTYGSLRGISVQNSRALSFPDVKKTKTRRHNVLLKEI